MLTFEKETRLLKNFFLFDYQILLRKKKHQQRNFEDNFSAKIEVDEWQLRPTTWES